MAVNLRGKSFLTLMDFEPEEIRYLLDLAKDLKANARSGIRSQMLKGKNICLLFEKTSTRTRCAFEVACCQEDGNVTFLDSKSSQMGKKESLEDTAKVLGRFFDGIEYRGYDQSVVENLAKYAGVPVWNGLTDVDHPTQILADMMTIEEHVPKPLSQVKVVFCGDVRNNMSYAWMQGCAKMGMNFTAYGPKELAEQIDPDVIRRTKEVAEKTDIWASMGEEDQIPARVKLLTPYRVTEEMLKKTGNKDVIFMHCLPSFHDFETTLAKEQNEKGYDIREVTDEVFRSKNSKVFDEAENRMHTIKSVIVATIG